MDAFLGSAAVCVGAYGSCVGAYGSCLKMGASCFSQLACLTFQHFWALDGRVWPRRSATPKRMFRTTTRTQPWQQRLDWKKRMWRLYGRSRDNEMAMRKIKNGSRPWQNLAKRALACVDKVEPKGKHSFCRQTQANINDACHLQYVWTKVKI